MHGMWDGRVVDPFPGHGIVKVHHFVLGALHHLEDATVDRPNHVLHLEGEGARGGEIASLIDHFQGWQRAQCWFDGCPPSDVHRQDIEGSAVRHASAAVTPSATTSTSSSTTPTAPHAHTGIKGEAAQGDLLAGQLGKVCPHVHSLAWHERQIRLQNRRGQQTSIRANDQHGHIVAPGQLIGAGVRAVEEAQPVSARLKRENGVRLAVHQDAVAQKAPHIVRLVQELVVAVEESVLNDHWYIVCAAAGAGHSNLFIPIPDVEQTG